MIVGEIPKPSHPDVRRDKNTNRIVNLRGFEVMIEQKQNLHPTFPFFGLLSIQWRIRLALSQRLITPIRCQRNKDGNEKVSRIRLCPLGKRTGSIAYVKHEQNKKQLRPRAQN